MSQDNLCTANTAEVSAAINTVMQSGSGVYSLTHIESGRSYVGKSLNLANRAYQHLYSLSNNKHHNPHVQQDYNSSKGNSAFEFRVLEFVPPARLNAVEQSYINSGDFEYNITGKRGSPSSKVKRTYSVSYPIKVTYVTPWGSFSSPVAASNACDGLLSADMIDQACMNPFRTVTRRVYGRLPYLKSIGEHVIGSNWVDLGFTYFKQQ